MFSSKYIEDNNNSRMISNLNDNSFVNKERAKTSH
jgi:hypothetical protein